MIGLIDARVLGCYGIFLIVCGIISVVFIGSKAKTALISGGTSGIMALFSAYLIYTGVEAGGYSGLLLSVGLTIVFSWRSTKTLFKVFELIPVQHSDLKGKGIAFLIISLMAIVSVIVTLLQIVF